MVLSGLSMTLLAVTAFGTARFSQTRFVGQPMSFKNAQERFKTIKFNNLPTNHKERALIEGAAPVAHSMAQDLPETPTEPVLPDETISVVHPESGSHQRLRVKTEGDDTLIFVNGKLVARAHGSAGKISARDVAKEFLTQNSDVT